MVSQSMLQDAVRFVLYELGMLRECAHLKPDSTVIKNLRYEGMVLHARVLRDFFFTKVKNGKRDTRPDDIVAVDFFATQFEWPYTSANLSPYLQQNRTRMDRTLAHLSFDRQHYKGQNKDWSSPSLLSEIGCKWFEFLALLEQGKQPAAVWFLELIPEYRIPLSPPL